MRVALDRERCTGHGRCYTLAPGLFRDDEEGYGVLLVDDVVPAGLEAEAELAAQNCPEQAITVSA